MVGGVLDLLKERGDDFLPAAPEAGVVFVHVVFNQGMQLGKVVIGHQWEHQKMDPRFGSIRQASGGSNDFLI